MDCALIHRVYHFILEDGTAIHFAVPHKVKYMRLAPPSDPSLQMLRVVVPWCKPAPIYVPVFTSGCQFAAKTIVPPRTVSAVEGSVRASGPGDAFPAWSLEFDAKLIVETPEEIVPPTFALASTLQETACFAVVDLFTGSPVKHNTTVYLPLCPFGRVVVVRILEQDDLNCVLECRDESSTRTMLLKMPVRFVDAMSFRKARTLHAFLLQQTGLRAGFSLGLALIIRSVRGIAAWLGFIDVPVEGS